MIYLFFRSSVLVSQVVWYWLRQLRVKGMVNMATGAVVSCSAFWSIFWSRSKDGIAYCRPEKSLYPVFYCIAVVCLATLGSNVLINSSSSSYHHIGVSNLWFDGRRGMSPYFYVNMRYKNLSGLCLVTSKQRHPTSLCPGELVYYISEVTFLSL